MKKLFALTVLLMFCAVSFSQKNKNDIAGKGLYFGVTYSKPTRTEFDKYMTVISDSLKLTSPLVAKNGYGISLGIIFRNNKGEFEAGGSYVSGIAAKSNNANSSTTASLSTNTFDIHFGYSVYVAGPLFIGLDFGAISNDGKITITGGNASLFEPSPESHNPFKGYVFFARPKGGFFVPFKKNKVTGFRLSAFYDMSISKYDFYNKDIFSMRLKNYKGDTKTSFRGLGIQASLVLALD